MEGKKSITGQNKSNSEQKGSVEPKKDPKELFEQNVSLVDNDYKDLL